MEIKKIALIGNQNCGKTTLFNALTGSNQHIGNFPGVTVEQKTGYIKNNEQYELIDLPGIYSLTPYSLDEVVSVQFLLNDKPHFIINIVDATHLERNLYLTLQLMELNIPMILVLNMMDEIKTSGTIIHIEKLKKQLQMPVIPISASQEEGIDEIIKTIEYMIDHPTRHIDLTYGMMKETISLISSIIEKRVYQLQLPLHYCTMRVIEDDKQMIQKLHITHHEQKYIHQIIKDMENKLQVDKDIAFIQMRYTLIDHICQQCIIRVKETKAQIISDYLDSFLTHQYLGIPIFILIIIMIFYLTFYVLGQPLQNHMEVFFQYITQYIDTFLNYLQVTNWVKSFICDGILAGLGSVLSFLPVIIILFLFLSLLEDSGYMARVAFIMDRALRDIGLSGKSIVPMLIGFGCSVPAIMSTRTLSSVRDRKLTMILIPFMSCSAKLPIYGMIITAFFQEKAAIVMITIYCIGIFVAILSALLLKKTLFLGEPIPFLLELPTYRIPTYKNIIYNIYDKAKGFVHKAFTVILLSSIIIWFLQSFNFQLEMVEKSSQSILASIGTIFSPLFKPLGFDDWRASTALITGITAKETVVSTFSVLTSSSHFTSLNNALITIFTPLSSFTFLVFTVLYMPCVATLATMKKELGSWKQALIIVLFQSGIAYLVALFIFKLGSLLI